MALRFQSSLDDSKFQAALGRMNTGAASAAGKIGKAFAGVGPSLIAGLSIGAVVGFGKSLIELGGDLQDSADRLDLTTDALQGLGYAFGQSGAKQEDFEKGMIKLNQSIQDARDGSDKARASFRALGVDFVELKDKSPEEVLFLLADVMKNAKDPTEALSAAMDILGKSGAKLIPALKGGADGLRELAEEAKKVTPEDVKTLDDAGDAIARMGREAKAFVASRFAETIRTVVGGEGQAGNLGDRLRNKLKGIGGEAEAPDFDPEIRKRAQDALEQIRKQGVEDIPGINAELGKKDTSEEDRLANFQEFMRAEQNEQRINAELREAANKADAEWQAVIAKNQAEAAEIVKAARMEAMSDEERLNALMEERVEISKKIAEANPVEASKLQIDLAKKSAEIARLTKAKQEKDQRAGEERAGRQARVAGARQAYQDASGKLNALTGGKERGLSLGGLSTGGLGGLAGAHHQIRRGDAARAKEAKKNKTEEATIETAEALKVLLAVTKEAWE